MIRSILLVLGESPYDASAKNFAFWLARKEGSQIQALAVIDIAAFEVPVIGTPDGFMPSVVAPPLRESRNVLMELTDVANERLNRFSTQCAKRGIPCFTEHKTGMPGDIINRASIAHDIVVLSRAGYGRISRSEEGVDAFIAPAIRASVRPVLVVGLEFREDSEIRNILVAYDGSRHAARALSLAADLANRPGVSCTLLTVAPSEEVGREVLEPAETFLGRRGIMHAKQVKVGSKPSDVICNMVKTGGVDLLIMGAYGHSPIREVLFGSTTEHVLANCNANVILQS
jgi:nucleotide-binding universal stress UspA family protein